MIVLKFRMPISEYELFMENYSFHHFALLVDSHNKDRIEFFETMAMTVSVGYGQARTGKEIKMFRKEGEGEKVKKVSAEKREETMDFLNSSFKKQL